MRPRRRRGRPAPAADFSGLEPTRAQITIVVDEMLDREPMAFPLAQGARLLFINDLMPGAQDEDVAAFANLHHALVATFNVTHFRRHISRRTRSSRASNRHASLLGLTCDAPRTADRLRETWDFIRSEWDLARQRSDKRIFLEIGNSFARTFR